jgi:putative ABC transport system permease protein
VAADTRYRELTVHRPTAYRPRDQFEAAAPYLAVRTANDPVRHAAAVRRAGEAMWPGATFSSIQRLDHFSTEPLTRSRVTAALFVAFAAICLLMSTIGLYGVITIQVVARTREIGIRMALGARRGAVLRAVLLEGAMMTLFGLMGGTAMAALLGGWLHTILYGVAVHDAATIAIVAVLISVVAGVATYLPARRAAGIEPTAALRDW